MKPLMVSTGDVLVLHPRDVVLHAVAVSPVRYHWISARSALAVGSVRERDRRLEMLDDLGDLLVVAAADLVDLFDELCRCVFTRRELSPYLLGEALEVGHADAGVQVVGAGGQDVLARRPASCW